MGYESKPSPALFHPGQILATPGAIDATGNLFRIACLQRHLSGDWGGIDKEDWATNDEAVQLGNRILSAYAIDPAKPSKGWGDNTLWIITEADRSTTTFLLPDEY